MPDLAQGCFDRLRFTACFGNTFCAPLIEENHRRWGGRWGPEGASQLVDTSDTGSSGRSCFSGFLAEYSLARSMSTQVTDNKSASIRAKTEVHLRYRMAEWRGLDAPSYGRPSGNETFLRDEVRLLHGATGKNLVSLVSKLAALAFPSQIAPIDSFARNGLKRLRRSEGNPFNCLESPEKPNKKGGFDPDLFQRHVHVLLEEFDEALSTLDVPSLNGQKKAAKIRAIDIYLMTLGGNVEVQINPMGFKQPAGAGKHENCPNCSYRPEGSH